MHGVDVHSVRTYAGHRLNHSAKVSELVICTVLKMSHLLGAASVGKSTARPQQGSSRTWSSISLDGKRAKKNDTCRIRTCAGEPNALELCAVLVWMLDD